MDRPSDRLDAARRATPLPFDSADDGLGAGPEPLVRRTVRELRTDRELSRPARGTADARLAPAEHEAADPLAGLLAQLRAVTMEYVAALRGDGQPPQQVVVRVKTLVRDALTAEGCDDPDTARSLTAVVVGWSIDAYYDG